MAPELVWQPSLFGGGGTAVRPRFAGLRRIQLDGHSWVDHVPGWVTGADALFETLLAAGDWRQRRRWMYDRQVDEPRLTAGFEVQRPARTTRARLAGALTTVGSEEVEDFTPGADAGTAVGHDRMPAVLGEICAALSDRYAVDFDRVWVNLYRNGADSVAWHGDRNARVHRNPLVATVSLGAQRPFQLRRAGSSTIAHELRPGAGDLIVMGGACQHDWQHAVPKTKRAVGARMSITIRHSVGEPADAAAGDAVVVPPRRD